MVSIIQLVFPMEFIEFHKGWFDHVLSTLISLAILLVIVAHLFKTKHATLRKDLKNKSIVCGDIRVWGWSTLFGGPAGLTFGLPYFWFMEVLDLSGWLREYWTGFIYVQFAASVINVILLFWYAATGPRDEWYRFFKSHLKGCGWISALSPVGWIAYVIQQFLPNQVKFLMWIPRDVETIVLLFFNVFYTPLLPICAVASVIATITHQKPTVVFPTITWIDEDHKEDEDSSQ